MVSKQERLTFIDISRTYAILLALFAHALNTTDTFKQLGGDALLVTQFTKMATPMFVFMFGFMIEYVYTKRAKIDGLAAINKRLLIRSFQCYIAYTMTSFCAVLGGYKSVESFLGSLVFLADSRFGNILRVYAVLLLLAPFIIKLRLKYGAWFLFFSLFLLIMSFSLIHQLDTVDFGAFNHPANILIGVGTVKGGPSVYHSLSFLLTGMYMASSLSENNVKKAGGFLSFYMVSVELIITFLLLGHFFIQENAQVAWKLFSSGTYRVSNMTAYYIIGVVGSVATITLFCFLIGNKALPKPIAFFLPLGTSSLISYTVGNMFLNIFGLKASSVSSVSFILIFFLSVILLTKYIDRMPCFTLFNNLLNFKYNRG